MQVWPERPTFPNGPTTIDLFCFGLLHSFDVFLLNFHCGFKPGEKMWCKISFLIVCLESVMIKSDHDYPATPGVCVLKMHHCL